MPGGRLIVYCVDPQHLAAHRTTTSSSRAKFEVRLLLGPPRMWKYVHFDTAWRWTPTAVHRVSPTGVSTHFTRSLTMKPVPSSISNTAQFSSSTVSCYPTQHRPPVLWFSTASLTSPQPHDTRRTPNDTSSNFSSLPSVQISSLTP